MNPLTKSRLKAAVTALCGAFAVLTSPLVDAAPAVKRLTPPSALFSLNDPEPPYISRFLQGQRFDLQATIAPDPGQTISSMEFSVDGQPVPGQISCAPATAAALPINTIVASIRAYSTI